MVQKSSSPQASVFSTDSGGNARVDSSYNGANSINASGGSSSSPTVDIVTGANLTGNVVTPPTPATPYILLINSGGYSVTNAGTLSGTNHDGIDSNFVFSLSNSGTIAGGSLGGRAGISTPGGSTLITNTGTIKGTNNAIVFNTNGGGVNNSGGTISGVYGGTSTGIVGLSGVNVNNTNGGYVWGMSSSINVGGSLNLSNDTTSNIRSLSATAVIATDHALISNYGQISSTQSVGISTTNLANITNYSSNYSAINGATTGIITGDYSTITNGLNGGHSTISGSSGFGVKAGFNLQLTNYGTISATIGTGVQVADDSSITNNAGATISGTANGIAIVANATTGPSMSSSITNNGTINGNAGYGIYGDTQSQTVTSNGSISGQTAAIYLQSATSTITLNQGSQVTGDINMNNKGGDVLNFGQGQASTTDATNIVSGNVKGVNTINKNSGGYAFINTPSGTGTIQADTINVNSAGLYLNGNVSSNTLANSTINVSETGELGGTGTWNANITVGQATLGTNYAVFSPGSTAISVTSTPTNSVGSIYVNGNVTLKSDAIYRWNYQPNLTSLDALNLGGTSVFTAGGATFQLAPTNVNAPLQNVHNLLIVGTNSTLSGTWAPTLSLYHQSTVSNQSPATTTPDTGVFVADLNPSNPVILSFATLSQVQNNTSWALSVSHNYGAYGTTHNQVAAGNMLDGLVNTATGSLADLLAAMDYSNALTTRQTLAALDPGAYMAAAAGLASNNYQLHRAVEDHNAEVREESAGGQTPAPSAPSAKGAVAPAQGVIGSAGGASVWGDFSYDWQNLKTYRSDFNQHGEVGTFTAGVDYTISNDLRLGLVADGAKTSWDGSNSRNADTDSYRFAGYANWGAATGWFVDALLGYNTNSVDQSQGATMGNYHAKQAGSFHANGWQGMITAGDSIATTSAGVFSPYIGVEGQVLRVDSFTAAGGSLLPVSIGSYDINSCQGLVGVKWSMPVAQNVNLYASASYAYEFLQGSANTTVHFMGGAYKAYGTDLGDEVQLSAGVRWGFAARATLDVGYRGEYAISNGINSSGANIGLNYSF